MTNVNHLYGTITTSNATVTTSTTAVVAANGWRKYCVLVNSGTNPVFLALGVAAVADKGIYLAPSGGRYEINEQNLFTGAINGIAVGGDSNVTITEV